MKVKSVIKSNLFVFFVVAASFAAQAKQLQLPANSCVDYISVNNVSELDCTWKWSASMGTGNGECPLSYSVRIGGVADNSLRDAGGYAVDGRHTGLFGVVTAGVAEVIWQVGIKSFIVKDNALMEVKRNYHFLNAHRCR